MTNGSVSVEDPSLDASTTSASQEARDPLNCDTIVRSAAFASECGIGIFLRGPWNNLEAVTQFGVFPWAGLPAADVLVPRLTALRTGEILIFDDLTCLRSSSESDRTTSPTKESIRFFTAAPVYNAKGFTLGVLVVADIGPRPGLSKAQQYVLRTHAAQLGAMLDFQALRRSIRVQKTSDTERLRLLESVVVNANDAVLITEAEPIDLPGPRIVYCNRAFEKSTGYSEAEVLGKTPRILQSDTIDRHSLARLKGALANWRPVEVELLNRRKDGTEFWVELSIVPVANEKGWYTHWVSVQRDVSDRKRSEEIATRARIAEVENKALEAEILERKRVEAQLLYEAFHDHLTKLNNRAFFMDRLAAALAAARDTRALNTVLFLDLDGFKLVNDSLGHRAGDHLLMVAAGRLRECVRPNDILARIGGDEFAVLLEGGDLDAGIGVAERIIKSLRIPVMLGNQRVFPSCSIGIAQSGDGILKPDEFLRNADIAMYEAKKRDLGGYAVFKSSMHKDVSDALALRMDLRQAVAREEFRLFFQLICDPATSHITGVEALVRWQHPTQGLVSPLTFVPVAEEIGIIRDIGRWVLREACNQLCLWNKRFRGLALRMNVNVSGDELRDPAFVPDLLSILQETNVDPRQLQLEITESVFLRQPDLIGAVLETIRSSGVRIALDDFGTGFSSLSYIDQYPIDAIKIDRSFVARMLSHRRTLAIIETIIKLGEALDLQIVAEGVETDEQREKLTSLRCSHAQGFLFAKPMPVAAVTAAIEAHDAKWRSGALSLQRRLGAACA